MEGISKVSRFVRVNDPAVQAWRKVLEAGEDDVAYESAIMEFENAAPTTPRGVTLKTKLLWQRLNALFQGDQLTSSGRQMMRAFRMTIDNALAHLAKQGKARWIPVVIRTLAPAHPDPTPPLGRGARRRRPDVAKPLA
jgi:hypothetical protein